jgi:hypothetical protein
MYLLFNRKNIAFSPLIFPALILFVPLSIPRSTDLENWDIPGCFSAQCLNVFFQ